MAKQYLAKIAKILNPNKSAMLSSNRQKKNIQALIKTAVGSYDVEMTISLQASLTRAIQRFLAAHGLNYSEAAVRDLSEIGTVQFGPAEAVSALNSLDFVSGFGALDPKTITSGHCPLIAFEKSGLAVTIL